MKDCLTRSGNSGDYNVVMGFDFGEHLAAVIIWKRWNAHHATHVSDSQCELRGGCRFTTMQRNATAAEELNGSVGVSQFSLPTFCYIGCFKMAFQVLWVYRLPVVSFYYKDAALKVNHNMTRAARDAEDAMPPRSLPALSLLS